jgi:hypothetical protein
LEVAMFYDWLKRRREEKDDEESGEIYDNRGYESVPEAKDLGFPDGYQEKIESALGVSIASGAVQLDFEYETVADARLHLKTIRQIQSELKFIKKEVNTDMAEIRATFRD